MSCINLLHGAVCVCFKRCSHWLQVAEQQGKYLAKAFNKLAKDPSAKIDPFNYRHMGSMASIGMLHPAWHACLTSHGWCQRLLVNTVIVTLGWCKRLSHLLSVLVMQANLCFFTNLACCPGGCAASSAQLDSLPMILLLLWECTLCCSCYMWKNVLLSRDSCDETAVLLQVVMMP